MRAIGQLPGKHLRPADSQGRQSRVRAPALSSTDGLVTLVYDHHARLLPEKLTELQHHYHAAVLSALHVHLDHDNCLEVVLVKGKAGLVQKVSNALIAIKGVKHGRFTITTSGHDLP